MPAINKAIEAATRLLRNGDLGEATDLIRKAVSGVGDVVAKTMVGPGASVSSRAERDPATCCAPPGNVAALASTLSSFTSPFWPSAANTTDLKADATRGSFVMRSHAERYGSRNYKLFRPDLEKKPTALLVMLHGCSQNPDDFAVGTRMNDIAARHNVAVVYPEQSRSANASGCWNWFEPKDQHRDAGEPGILAGLTRAIAAEFGIGPNRTFVAGLSAGGAMAAILAELYPDLYAAVGIHSGLAYGAASDMSSAFSAMQGNGGGKGGWFGQAATAETIQHSLLERAIPVIVLHGDADRTVHPHNADAIVAQITARETGLQTETETGACLSGRSFVRTLGRDAKGAIRFENWSLGGAGHAWAGGSRSGSYTDPDGPDASAEMMRFFLQAC
ncbi:PHB depolymerase family esterase [Lichenihabitans sp. PAMC28606]|uniref:extracellular catalytic domain type 1 short-chain-length polyhydroxyalkanoate depolymerase n=1 Tax=Lichenihabitans sp. PAMC28606 TaxID=2880932 RepID=UPI001D0B9B87|nr:PHB depolymerase family esterase [Lichenihabitans sp. PAMC28606]UDL94886.1 PHB depolymerase family esterase [Lichenihabitans sp. PAMC28606]